MSTKHRELLMELIAKRFEKVLNEDARDVLQILMELYCDAKALDQITIENRPTVPAVPAAQAVAQSPRWPVITVLAAAGVWTVWRGKKT